MLDLMWTDRPLGRMTASREAIRARTHGWAPTLAARAEDTDARRELPPETVVDIKALGLARILQPKRYGGEAAPVIALADVMIPTAAASGATAWALAQYIMHNFMIARWPQEAQDRIWGEAPDALVAGILIPRLGQVERVQGGYSLSGRWPLVTGVNTADWCMLSAFVPDPDGAAIAHYFMVPTAEVTIIDTWNALGLKGSASNDVAVKDLFVPDFMVSSDAHMKGQPHPGLALHPEPIYRLPVYMCFGSLLSSAVVGMAEAMLSAYLARNRQGLGSMTGEESLDQSVNHLKVAEATACLRAAQSLLACDCDEMMDYAEAGQIPEEARRSGYRRDAAFAGKLATQAATLLWDLSGARGAYEPNPIGRAWRDLSVAGRHLTQKWEQNGIEAGRSAMGLPLTNPSL
jgi:3-hydroxy-9,10-secoandrosta-1,3,5(10)-triene-9,17-dione monooxygenase